MRALDDQPARATGRQGVSYSSGMVSGGSDFEHVRIVVVIEVMRKLLKRYRCSWFFLMKHEDARRLRLDFTGSMPLLAKNLLSSPCFRAHPRLNYDIN